jgi:capsule polysaccharide export protein KpsC/LpsZ
MEYDTYSRENMNTETSIFDEKRVYLEVTRRANNNVNEIFVYMLKPFTSNIEMCWFPKPLGLCSWLTSTAM